MGASRCGPCLIAAAVTLTDAVLAWPFAYAMVRLAGPRLRAVLMTAGAGAAMVQLSGAGLCLAADPGA